MEEIQKMRWRQRERDRAVGKSTVPCY